MIPTTRTNSSRSPDEERTPGITKRQRRIQKPSDAHFTLNHSGANVAFIQGKGLISQTVSGFDLSKLYTVTYFVSGRG